MMLAPSFDLRLVIRGVCGCVSTATAVVCASAQPSSGVDCGCPSTRHRTTSRTPRMGWSVWERRMSTEEVTEVRWFRQWRTGDKRAGDRLLRRYSPLLQAFFRRRRAANVEELVQSTL